MIFTSKRLDFEWVSDNSLECSDEGAFLLTKQNEMYLEDVKKSSTCKVIKPPELIKLLGINEKIKIVGITGTNGKTTTAAALYSILLDLGKKVAFQGTRGCFIGEKRIQEKSLTTPTILQNIANIQEAVNEGCEYFVMEVSSHGIAQERIEGLEFALKVFTNISQDHLDYHKTFDRYVAVKSSFFADDTPKLINKDDGKIRFNRKNCMTYGCDNPATYKVAAYSLRDGISAVVQKIDKMVDFHSPMHGYFNLYNLLAAIAAADMLQVATLEDIAEVVPGFAGVSGRMEVVSTEPLVIVDFAHTPDGMDKILDALKDKKLFVLFGAGGDRDKDKRPLMGKVASRYADKIVITSDNPRSEAPREIIKDIQKGVDTTKLVHVNEDRYKALEFSLMRLQEDEVLVVLGKGDETHQEIAGKKIPFSDKEAVLDILQKLEKV